jgi:hypothetical protein
MSSLLSASESHPESPASAVFDLPTQSPTAARQDSRLNLPQLAIPSTLGLSDTSSEPSYIFLSGGTGGNAICSAFERACYVLPVSDDGGSSSEIIRVLGGPSIGNAS